MLLYLIQFKKSAKPENLCSVGLSNNPNVWEGWAWSVRSVWAACVYNFCLSDPSFLVENPPFSVRNYFLACISTQFILQTFSNYFLIKYSLYGYWVLLNLIFFISNIYSKYLKPSITLRLQGKHFKKWQFLQADQNWHI